MNPGPLACAWAEYVRLYVGRGQNQKGIRGKRGCGGPKALAEAEPGEPLEVRRAWDGREEENLDAGRALDLASEERASGEVDLYVTFL